MRFWLLNVLLLISVSSAHASASQSWYLSGLSLSSNESVTVGSGNSAATLVMQSDGNVVVYKNSLVAWASGTGGNTCGSGCSLDFQSDGNLVEYANGAAIWRSGTADQSAATLVFQNVAPYLQIRNINGSNLWQSDAALDITVGSLSLSANQSVAVGSGTAAASLIMQPDGNLVIYVNSVSVWSSGTGGRTCGSGCTANFQPDGNLVIYANGSVLWATGTNDQSGAYLVFQNEAPYLAVTNTIGANIWQSSGTLPTLASAQHNSVPPGPLAGDLNIMAKGAVPDGVTDNSDAINAAIVAAATGNKTVFVPPGLFAYSKVITINGVKVNGVGNASQLIALTPTESNPNAIAPIVLGSMTPGATIISGSILANVMVTVTYTGPRLTSYSQFPIYVSQAKDFQVDHVYVQNGAAGGIADIAGQSGKITNNTIKDTLADSILTPTAHT